MRQERQCAPSSLACAELNQHIRDNADIAILDVKLEPETNTAILDYTGSSP
jgi:hypothetical protein